MVKKIGSLFLFILFNICVCLAEDQIDLKGLDINGDPLNIAVVGEPFLLEVRVTSQDSIPGIPQVTGIQNLHVEDKAHVSTINSIVNGVRSMKKIYRYRVSSDKPGISTIGPALLINNKQRLQSNVLNLEITQERKQQKMSEPFLRMLVDKKNPIMGEPITFALRFYPLNGVNLEGISEPKLQDFSAQEMDGPFTGSHVIQGDKYNFIEWRTTLYPKKVGTIKVPPVTAVYKKARSHSHSGLEMFEVIFNGGFDQKQIHSNGISLNVQELPKHDGVVSGIGTFNQLSAHVDHTYAKEGEGIVYSLVLEGDGDLSVIEPIELKMPEGLKYYDSKSSINAQKKTKTFEYIVQGVKPGTWEIPTQQFTYFDLVSRTYKHLESNTITISIKSYAHRFFSTQQDNEIKKHDEKQTVTDDIAPINTIGPWHAQKERSLPWWLFGILFVLSTLAFCFKIIGDARKRYLMDTMGEIKRKKAFSIAREALSLAQQNNNIKALHGIFIDLFNNRLKRSSIDQITIDRILEQSGLANDQLMAWNTFFDTLLQFKFFGKADKNHNNVFTQAEDWINQLEKLL